MQPYTRCVSVRVPCMGMSIRVVAQKFYIALQEVVVLSPYTAHGCFGRGGVSVVCVCVSVVSVPRCMPHLDSAPFVGGDVNPSVGGCGCMCIGGSTSLFGSLPPPCCDVRWVLRLRQPSLSRQEVRQRITVRLGVAAKRSRGTAGKCGYACLFYTVRYFFYSFHSRTQRVFDIYISIFLFLHPLS